MQSRFLFSLFFLALFAFSACGDNAESNTPDNAPTDNLSAAEKLNPALIKLNAAVKENPDDAALYAQRGAAYWEVQGYDEAIADLEKAVELDGEEPAHYHLLADYYLDYFRSSKALKTMETAGLKFPQRIPTLLKLSEFYLILKNHGAADRTLDRIAAIRPLDSEMFFMRGRVQEDQGNIPGAINFYQFAVENNSDFIEAYLKLGNLTAETDPKTALKYYDNALRIAPENTDALLMKAYHLSNQMNDLPAAQAVYRKVHTLDPQNKTAFHNSGLLYLDQDSLQRAYDQFTFAIKASPIAVESYYYRGLTSEMRGDIGSARDDYAQVVKMNPGFTKGKEALQRVSNQPAQ